jgi:hypothetical protein
MEYNKQMDLREIPREVIGRIHLTVLENQKAVL